MSYSEKAVKIVGVGGQGVRVAGVVLGTAATIEGKFAAHWQSYGVETRGGPSISDVIISERRILYPRATSVDFLVVMAHGMLGTYIGCLKPGGLLLLDEDLVKEEVGRGDVVVKKAPMARVADGLGQRLMVNMVMLGALVSATRLLSEDSLVKAIEQTLPEQHREASIRAFRSGLRVWELGCV